MKIKKRYIFITILLFILIAVGIFIFQIPTTKVKFCVYTQQKRLNEIVDYMRNQYKPGINSASLNCSGRLYSGVNENFPEVIKVEENNAGLIALKYLNEMYGDKEKENFIHVNAYYDENGNMQLVFKAFSKETSDEGIYQAYFLIYMDDNFIYSGSNYKKYLLNITNKYNVNFFKKNWGIYNYKGTLG